LAMMRVACPVDEPTHVILWHDMPALLGIIASVGLGYFGLRRLRRRV